MYVAWFKMRMRCGVEREVGGDGGRKRKRSAGLLGENLL